MYKIQYVVWDISCQVELCRFDTQEEADEVLDSGALDCSSDYHVYPCLKYWKIKETRSRIQTESGCLEITYFQE
jgi:hypothetical protein